MREELDNKLPRTPDSSLVWTIGYINTDESGYGYGPYRVALDVKSCEALEPIEYLDLYPTEDFDSPEPPMEMIVRCAYAILGGYALTFTPRKRPYQPLAGVYKGKGSPLTSHPTTNPDNTPDKKSWWRKIR